MYMNYVAYGQVTNMTPDSQIFLYNECLWRSKADYQVGITLAKVAISIIFLGHDIIGHDIILTRVSIALALRSIVLRPIQLELPE